ncbi:MULTISPECIES: TIGR02647 family protein [Pseudomonas]|uniref:TIGR02647 family protein n=1 Tax=Pseudomonas mosselii TaxID=78327 RepID=A0AA42RUB7_9PSED|nr:MULTISPECIES: TIGR02647 family protein [Pseudomonas]MBI6900087.1 TIGR02647 family protein [Pseudomonas putida]MDC0686761.1 TIGR02647 family protein [Mitsuaria sp. RG]KNX80668.1 DNA-binding protein [Pseudomonas sp. 250J]MCE0913045.1 TIGR02647 family protein [Pseudomonas sp. NMI760_13]MCF1488764.1 TIGR02647 family protein [Pseudomonas sp. AA27]
MPFNPELIAELEVLAQFNLDSHQEGIKVCSDASPALVAAAKRLHDKGLTDQPDGGYLTSLGTDAAESMQLLLRVLKTPQPA